MSDLNRAIEIAAKAHAGQVDKAGAPYILHPIRVMMKMNSVEAMIAGVFHDLVEDTPWSIKALEKEGFSSQVLEAVDHLTWRQEESYEEFMGRVRLNPLAVVVKIADLEDNIDLTRITKPGQKDFDRVKKYKIYLKKLKAESNLTI